VRVAILDRWAGGHDGPGVYVRELCQGLRLLGHEVLLAFDTTRGEEASPGVREVAIHGLSGREPDETVVATTRAALASFRAEAVLLECLDVPWFAGRIRAHAPIVWSLHTHTLTCPNWSRVLWRRNELCARDLSAACAYHHFVGGCGRGAGVRTLVRELVRCHRARRQLAAIDGLHALNSYMANTFLRAGFPEARIRIAQYPAPLFDEGALWVDQKPDPGLVLFVGRLDREKGFQLLLESSALMRTDHRIRIVGASELDRGRSIRGHENTRVEVIGPVTSRQALSEHYGQAAVVVVPSIWGDPSPLVRLEAMAHGRPVVGFDSGGVGSVIEQGVTGLLVERANVAALAGALDSLISEPERARRMGRAARAAVETRHTRARHATDLLEFLQSLRPRARELS